MLRRQGLDLNAVTEEMHLLDQNMSIFSVHLLGPSSRKGTTHKGSILSTLPSLLISPPTPVLDVTRAGLCMISGIEPRTSLEIDMLSLNLLDPYSPQGGCTLGTNSVRPSM